MALEDRSEPDAARRTLAPALLRWTPAVIALACVAAVFASGVWRHLSLDDLRARRAFLKALVAAHPVASLCLYVGLYAVLVGLSIPGALIMTLTGGFLFGGLAGGAAAVLAVSTGSLMMFLIARTALGGTLRALASRSALMRRLEAEIGRHAFICILSLRLLPAAPIWVVNILAGLTRIPLRVYALATVIGVTPSSFLYAGVGAGLDGLFNRSGPLRLRDLLGPGLMIPLLLLGALSVASAVAGVAMRRKR